MDIGAAITGMIESIIKAPFIIIGWLIIGAIAGDLARRLMRSKDQGVCSDWLLGVIGAIVGGLLASLFGLAKPDGGLSLVLVNLVVATVGAVVLIMLRRALTGART